MKQFPAVDKNYRFLQVNRGNMIGNIWSSFGLDFQSNVGVIRAGKKLAINTDTTDDADLGLPSAFQYFADRWWAVCGLKVFKNGSELLTSSFAEDTSTNVPTDCDPEESDLAVFDGRLWVTSSGALLSKTSNTGDWTSRDSIGSGIHKLQPFKKTNRLYYTDTTSRVSSIDEDDVVANTSGDYCLELANDGSVISTMTATSDQIFISTIRRSNSSSGQGTQGSVLTWDGVSPQITAEFRLVGAGVLCMWTHENTPYAVDTFGRILRFVGYGFEEIARLPIGDALLQRATSSGGSGIFIHHNGMVSTTNNTLLISISNLNEDSGATVQENIQSGVWELDLSNGNLTHKHAFTLKDRGSTTITDYAQNRMAGVGAIKLNTFQADSSAGRSSLIAGGTIYTDATTSKSAIFVEDPLQSGNAQKRPYLVTNWFTSDQIEDNWQKIWTVYRRFLSETDKMTFKYRFDEEAPIEATITWVDTTHFTTTTDITAYYPTATGFDGVYGGEVEVLAGTGSGACVHITNVTLNTGTYTVTIDNVVTGVTTGTAKARFQKWIKLLPEITGQVNSYAELPIGKNSTRIQIKCCMEFTGENEFHKFMLVSESHLQAN